jgi:hypothetical protein
MFPMPPLVPTPVASERSQSRSGSASAYERSMSALFRRSATTTSTRRPQSRVPEAYIEDVPDDEERATTEDRQRRTHQDLIPAQPANYGNIAQPPNFQFEAPWLPRFDIREFNNPYDQLRQNDFRQGIYQPAAPPEAVNRSKISVRLILKR